MGAHKGVGVRLPLRVNYYTSHLRARLPRTHRAHTYHTHATHAHAHAPHAAHGTRAHLPGPCPPPARRCASPASSLRPVATIAAHCSLLPDATTYLPPTHLRHLRAAHTPTHTPHTTLPQHTPTHHYTAHTPYTAPYTTHRTLPPDTHPLPTAHFAHAHHPPHPHAHALPHTPTLRLMIPPGQTDGR